MASDLIGAKEAAEMLCVERTTVIRLVYSGELTAAHKMDGLTGAYLFERAEVLRYRDELAAKAAS